MAGMDSFNTTALLRWLDTSADTMGGVNLTALHVTEQHHLLATDETWVMLCGFMVIFMQAGFSMLEAGSVRANNVKSILLKNMADLCIGTVGWCLTGYAFAYGDDNGTGLYGTTKFLTHIDTSEHAFFLFQLAFACTAATIVSGAVAERVKLRAYFANSLVILLVIYPFPCHWIWHGDGWLAQAGFLDFAGGIAVHAVGGVCGLVCMVKLGPRIGRFDKDLDLIRDIPAHSAVLTSLGTWILLLGWFGFNSGSSLGLQGGALDMATAAAANTMIAAVAAVLTSLTINEFIVGQHDIASILNSLLAGLVSITGSCAFVSMFSALLIGGLGGIIYAWCSHMVLHKLKLDDPVDAVCVHGACGIWGVVSIGLFDTTRGLFITGSADQLGIQLMGIAAVLAFTLVVQVAAIYVIDAVMRGTEQPNEDRAREFGDEFLFLGIRVSPDVELKGCDSEFSGTAAYSFLEEKTTLEETLADRELCGLFKQTLVSLQSQENLVFYEAVLAYEAAARSDLNSMAAALCKEYMTPGTDNELNIRGALKRNVMNNLGTSNPALFTNVKSEVLHMMLDTFNSHFVDSAELSRVIAIREEVAKHARRPACYCLAQICCGISRKNRATLNTMTIDEQIDDDMLVAALTNKVLVLGAGEAGKTTLVNQLVRVFNGGQVPITTRMRAKETLRENVFTCIKRLLKKQQEMEAEGLADSKVPAPSDQERALYNRILARSVDAQYSLADAKTVVSAWKSAPIQALWALRDSFWVLNNTMWYMDNALRFCDHKNGDAFELSDSDISMYRKKTTGVNVINAQQDGTVWPDMFKGVKVAGAEGFDLATVLQLQWDIVDVGGQRSERRKWLQYFSEVDCTIFVINLNGYHEVLYEDETKLKMHESIDLFKTTFNQNVANGPKGLNTRGVPVFVCFNKVDYFISNYKPEDFRKCFAAYGITSADIETPDTAQVFLARTFEQMVKQQCGVDTRLWDFNNMLTAIDLKHCDTLLTKVTNKVVNTRCSSMRSKLENLAAPIKRRWLQKKAAEKRLKMRNIGDLSGGGSDGSDGGGRGKKVYPSK